MACTFTAHVTEDNDVYILSRLTGYDASGPASPIETEGNLVKQADLASITLKTFDVLSAAPTTAVYSATLVISTVVFDALQTSGIWGLLEDGGNFLARVPAAALPTENRRYRVEITFTSAGGSVSTLKGNLDTSAVQGS